MMTNYNDGRWHGWNSDECPVHPDTVVTCMWQDKDGFFDGYTDTAKKIPWHSIDAFRVVKEYREPREGYVVTTLFETARDAKIVYPGCTPIKVREVIE